MLGEDELDEELAGCRREVDGITHRVDLFKFSESAGWMNGKTFQAVFRIQFNQPPSIPTNDEEEGEDDIKSIQAKRAEEQAKLDAAPRIVHVGVCLPEGYALLQADPSFTGSSSSSASAAGAASSSSSSSTSSSSDLPSFIVPSPLIIRDSMHSLLMNQSPVYATFKSNEMNQKLLQLYNQGPQQESSDED